MEFARNIGNAGKCLYQEINTSFYLYIVYCAYAIFNSEPHTFIYQSKSIYPQQDRLKLLLQLPQFKTFT